MQIVYCECGDRDILDGRCIKCKRVRPSSQEIFKQIDKNQKDLIKLLDELKQAIKLENEDKTGETI